MTTTLTIPHPENPQHVENLASVELLEAQGFQGNDASLAESLFQYGLAWRDLGNEWLIIYRHPTLAKRFGRCTLAKDTDPKRKWNWVEWRDVQNFCGSDMTDFTLLDTVEMLVNYYGTEEIFGSSCWVAISGEECDADMGRVEHDDRGGLQTVLTSLRERKRNERSRRDGATNMRRLERDIRRADLA